MKGQLITTTLPSPFFIIGCVRSGTTMLRNILRRHPNFACPEETHFYRWAEPIGTQSYNRFLLGNSTLKLHRQMDGIGEDEFEAMLIASTSRADLYNRYMGLFMERNRPDATRWFDKTPQNVYGAAMAAQEFPHAKFIHIVRDPADVVSSLRIGKIVKITHLAGACSYWNEAYEISATLCRAFPGRVHEVRYEDFVREPLQETTKIFTFLDESFDSTCFEGLSTRHVSHRDENVLTHEEVLRIECLCRNGRMHYGYT